MGRITKKSRSVLISIAFIKMKIVQETIIHLSLRRFNIDLMISIKGVIVEPAKENYNSFFNRLIYS